MKKIAFASILALGLAAPATAQDWDAVEIKPIKVRDNLYMMTGQGGNLGVSIGEDGVFLIDDQYAPLTEKILAAIKTLSSDEIQFVFNTHYHGDHTGGNENLGNKGIDIVAHDNVYKRLKDSGTTKEGLPVISFNDQLTFHLNGMDISARHYKSAHTDGDSIVYFQGANVIHMGDTFFNEAYPYVDVDGGGSWKGLLLVVKSTLNQINDDTKIIPGHGPLTDKAGLQIYHDVLMDIDSILRPIAERGLSLDEAKSLNPLEKYDGDYGNGFMDPDTFISIVYQNIKDNL
ncbi:MBL fold metallo-hydrolase [Pseudemcibacter aquimaris]|uniref:MBL fold metallo-hydrolase n=1 Tax=Pseudemcibacter aquimaris TaxID=2857064 RepID=UPI0020113B65|nr:MBL fold metallo-hydrolase [Pseudemcibacter aquimaris]MCC3860652.1 MBL fold metallo-hydrolase [Pseudemcibacter aquimaris]WDU59471.1 MBL fold metallo-hydrolase [Pseudemcibacter aquimaris]